MKVKILLLTSFLNFLAMFALTYVNIDELEDFYVSLNKIYMAAIMTMPMLVINVLIMHSMYENKRAATGALVGGVLGLVLIFFLIRNQIAVNNERFLKSMIPHHSQAILVCEQSNITDPEIESLCRDIVETQEEEILIMKRILTRYE
jgi:Na+/proline symporter